MISIVLAALLGLQATPIPPPEDPVDPYTQSNANAGATPFAGPGMLRAFHGKAGIARVVDELVTRSIADPRISDIFKGQDMVRLRRTLKEQFCFILNGGCDYTGRDMKASHKDLGLQTADFNALVENLQAAMRQEKVPFFAQNRLLAKLAPMKRDTVVR
ncbi:group I truncated hemoglobin [Sphingomonas sp. Leaf357]|uniref:group I truncated hemoglobin n=1 Tax=Sphingomonas sp. Leaf357 TaxID=1736350 RepID=UPI0009E80255|nr:group 1 truncated hemoglobin [Sphingomonas sp. Leaf357]